MSTKRKGVRYLGPHMLITHSPSIEFIIVPFGRFKLESWSSAVSEKIPRDVWIGEVAAASFGCEACRIRSPETGILLSYFVRSASMLDSEFLVFGWFRSSGRVSMFTEVAAASKFSVQRFNYHRLLYCFQLRDSSIYHWLGWCQFRQPLASSLPFSLSVWAPQSPSFLP